MIVSSSNSTPHAVESSLLSAFTVVESNACAFAPSTALAYTLAAAGMPAAITEETNSIMMTVIKTSDNVKPALLCSFLIIFFMCVGIQL